MSHLWHSRLFVWVVAALALAVPTLTGYALVHRQMHADAQRQTTRMAEQALGRVEFIIDRALLAVRNVADLDIAQCGEPQRQFLRRAIMDSAYIKDIALLAADGSEDCSGNSNDARFIRTSFTIGARDPSVLLATVNVAGADRTSLRVIWSTPQGRALAAIVATDALLPDRVQMADNALFDVRVELEDGAALGLPNSNSLYDSSPYRVDLRSERYPVRVTARADAAAAEALYGEMRASGVVLSVLIGGLLAALVLIIAKRRREDPVAELYSALRRGEFIPFYQPIIDLDSGLLKGCEVLARRRRPDGSMVPPSAFIDLAERSGFIFPLTLELMRKVSAELGPAYRDRPSMTCAINLCAEHFKDETIVRDVQEIFSRSQMSPRQIVLEVTERDALPDMDVARAIISRFQALGMKVALDDVGTGHGGMSYLLKLGVDIMKIDKMFVDAIGTERYSTAIIDSLIDLATHMRMEVVAEGVESFDQVEQLKRRGVRYAQGYVFSPPLPGSSFIQLVEAIEPRRAPKSTSVFDEATRRDDPKGVRAA